MLIVERTRISRKISPLLPFGIVVVRTRFALYLERRHISPATGSGSCFFALQKV
jgi:hypothetical protein